MRRRHQKRVPFSSRQADGSGRSYFAWVAAASDESGRSTTTEEELWLDVGQAIGQVFRAALAVLRRLAVALHEHNMASVLDRLKLVPKVRARLVVVADELLAGRDVIL